MTDRTPPQQPPQPQPPEDCPPDPEIEITRDNLGGLLPPRTSEPILDLETVTTPADRETSRRLNRAGRSPVFDVDLIGTIARFAALGLSNRAIAGKLGVNREALRQWRHERPELAHVWPIIEDLRIYALECKALDPRIKPASANIILRRLAQLSPEDWGKHEPEGESGALSPQSIAEIIERVAMRSIATMNQARSFPVRAARLIETNNDSGARTVTELPIVAEGVEQ